MIENVFDFNDTVAEDVMVHRTDMVMLWTGDTDEEIVQTIEDSGLSRFPVYEEDADDIVGIPQHPGLPPQYPAGIAKPLKELLRAAYFIPESVSGRRAVPGYAEQEGPTWPSWWTKYGGTSGW